ncbi:MAG: tRNA preQ1(34) S-adenosylmethionine ribosyltransferase-isomerase QueA [Ilumatobacteraceae bacterium]|nr:tRNA preQ1(34) S-adenosylmethionine ribosyltransferase-isomerase QueA [Ilumatobacteraceae bacterium]MBJ7369042.1 tRNA preQ1(34) S-adenosylmethionine ribosyltransferase-isomerase QueA [Ilumatobacteraceae bacterium]
MHLSDIDYELPEKLIAQHPVEPRDSARLLVATNPYQLDHKHMTDLVDMLEPGDVMVVNDTRVLPARLSLHRKTGGAAEVLLLEQRSSDFRLWEALVKPASKLKPDEVLEYFGKRVVRIGPRTEAGDTFVVEILDENPMELLQRIGAMPLPPYIRSSLSDLERYQTIYARRTASAAAPTAGLHFTSELMAKIVAKGVTVETVELVVGLDTFKPISTDDPLDHLIHSEFYSVEQRVMDACRDAKRVIAVGTTATRALESVAASGQLSGRTSLFITPGFQWQVVDMMLTNFHLPKTSLLLMIESFIGPRWRDIYTEAISEQYRFLSFGDAMLLVRS